MSRDAGVDVFIKIDFVLVDFSYLLLGLEELEGEQLGVVVLGVRKGLSVGKSTKYPLWMRWRR